MTVDLDELLRLRNAYTPNPDLGPGEHEYGGEERQRAFALAAHGALPELARELSTLRERAAGVVAIQTRDAEMRGMHDAMFALRAELEARKRELAELKDIAGPGTVYVSRTRWDEMKTIERERDEARAECERLREAKVLAEEQLQAMGVHATEALAETKQFTDFDLYCQFRELREAAAAVSKLRGFVNVEHAAFARLDAVLAKLKQGAGAS